MDDNHTNRLMLERRLASRGFRVLSAANGAEALERVRTEPCDLVLLDVMMPDMSGLDVLRRLRQGDATLRLPVIMVTAKDASADVVDALTLGADDYVTKPLDFPVALARIRAQLARVAAERLALERQRQADLQHAQKLSAVGLLTGGVAHDFNNLLTAITGYGEMLRDDLKGNDRLRGDVDRILSAAESAAALTRQLLAFSRRQSGEAKVVDIGHTVKSMARVLQRVIGESIAVNVMVPPGLWRVRADAGQLDQIVLNLVINASDAMPDGGALSVMLENLDGASKPHREPSTGGQFICLAVSDNGCGMDIETQARIFEPFFTTKAAGRGTGLGLAMVKNIAEQAGGWVTVDSEPGKGSTLRVYLPRAVAPDVEDGTAEDGGVLGGGGTVLVVEDDPTVRLFTREVLERAGYRAFVAESGSAALAIAAGHPGPIDVLVADVVMPVMSGATVWRAVKHMHPHASVVFMSGHDVEALTSKTEAGPLLSKPFTADRLLRAIEHAERTNAGSPVAVAD